MTETRRWTIADLDELPDDETTHYEIINGELLVTTSPSIGHQLTCKRTVRALDDWGLPIGAGEAIPGPGLVFAPEDAVEPDVVWIRRERLESVIGADGKIHDAPDLIVEVLSPGRKNEQRDRELKLDLYTRYGVPEYWIIDWWQQALDIYRHDGVALRLIATLTAEDTVTSPLLPGFARRVVELCG